MGTDYALALWVAGSVFLGSGIAELISIVWKREYSKGVLWIILAFAFYLSAQLVIYVRGM